MTPRQPASDPLAPGAKSCPGVRPGRDEEAMSVVPCRIGLLGFGIVGSAVARRLLAPRSPYPLRLTHIFDRRADEKRRRFTSAVDADPEQPLCWTDAFE